jgi:hypothetical protein
VQRYHEKKRVGTVSSQEDKWVHCRHRIDVEKVLSRQEMEVEVFSKEEIL